MDTNLRVIAFKFHKNNKGLSIISGQLQMIKSGLAGVPFISRFFEERMKSGRSFCLES